MRTDDRTRTKNDRATAAGLIGGAAVCAALAAGTESAVPVWLAAGMLAGALMVYRRTVERRPYAYWPAWVAGAALALLLAWQAEEELAPLVFLPLAGVEILVALVLFALWRRRRTGRGDWIVWLPDEGVLLRREWTRRDAIRWAEDDYRHPCAISPLDEFPAMANEVPHYPDHERPLYRAPRLDEQP
ncbi:hypothetical protein ACFY0G_40450 [Streptomyces sp. NPDC001552]|uniref:hypothetical protein n=1 Tax=Streptomyces sp. NPDC001552 TaxID=3364587 RepID=UPI0036B1E390